MAGNGTVWKLGRSDYLFLRALLVVPVIGAATGVVAAIVDWLRGAPAVVEAARDFSGPAATEGLVRGATGEYSATIRWQIFDAQWWERVLLLVPPMLTLAAAATVLGLIWPLLTQVQRDDVFNSGAVLRVRWVALVLLAYGILAPMLDAVVGVVVLWPRQHDPSSRFSLHSWMLWPFVAFLLLLVVAEVFDRGTKLRADVEGLV